jgi:chemotaxis receptor (MCP) glutamine deamidase CheD
MPKRSYSPPPTKFTLQTRLSSPRNVQMRAPLARMKTDPELARQFSPPPTRFAEAGDIQRKQNAQAGRSFGSKSAGGAKPVQSQNQAGLGARNTSTSRQHHMVCQRMLAIDAPVMVSVGFNRVNVARHGQKLATAGLANCVAIAVQDRTTGHAAMGHFDTMHLMGEGSQLTRTTSLGAFQRQLLTALRRLTGSTIDPVYSVSIGGIWFNAADNPTTDRQRHHMLMTIRDVFGVEAQECGAIAWFDTRTGRISGQKTDPDHVAEPLDNSWSAEGDLIAY